MLTSTNYNIILNGGRKVTSWMFQLTVHKEMKDWDGQVMRKFSREQLLFCAMSITFLQNGLRMSRLINFQMEGFLTLYPMCLAQVEVQLAGRMLQQSPHGTCTSPMVIKGYWKINIQV